MGALLYALGLIVLPALHLATHRSDHTHGTKTPEVDWSRVRDARTGRVNLDLLAEELGLGDAEHKKAHAENRSHQHDEHSSDASDHGRGAAEHFSLAILDDAQMPALTESVRRLELSLIERDVSAPAARLLFLDAQRAQAPPV